MISMNKTKKELLKVFIFLFVVSFIAINWNDVSWIFNYREISGLVSDFFNPYPDTASALIQANKAAGDVAYAYAGQNNFLEIPEIGVNTPVVIGRSTDKAILADNLDRGAVYYPGSVLPGQNGQIVILGHSAPPNWPHVRHDYIFSNIENLAAGDEIILNFNNAQYTYKVIDKKIIRPGQGVESNELSSTKNILTLISCWPPGRDYQRITVTAELVEV